MRSFFCRIHSLLFLLILPAIYAGAQDTVTLTNGKHIAGKVIGLSPYKVSYVETKAAGRSTRTRQVSKSMVTSIKYADGRVEPVALHRLQGTTDTGSNALSAKGLYELGRSDAGLYYRGYGGASNGTLLASCPGSPALGLIVAACTASTPPKEKNLHVPLTAFSQDRDYYAGYLEGAYRKKIRKVWTSWAVGSAATMILYFFLTSGQR